MVGIKYVRPPDYITVHGVSNAPCHSCQVLKAELEDIRERWGKEFQNLKTEVANLRSRLDNFESFTKNVLRITVELLKNDDKSMATSDLLSTFCVLWHHCDAVDVDFIADTIRAISVLTNDGNNEIILMVVDSGLLPFLVGFMDSTEINIRTAALRAVGNICTVGDEFRRKVLVYGALNFACTSLMHDSDEIKKETVRFCVNITAGNASLVPTLIDANLVPTIVHLLIRGDLKTQEEALSNLSRILKINGKKADDICWKIEECGGLDKIESLQNDKNEYISKLACELIDCYFSGYYGILFAQ